MLGASALLLAPTVAQAAVLPQGHSVAAGSATVDSPNSSTLDINQSSNRAIINWRSYSIGQGGTVNYHQPSAASATLNRITGPTPSSIAGTINAPGTVLLVNPNGIAITKTGVINTGSFAASTLDIKNSDFMAGHYKFTGNGSSAAVTNAGRIDVSDGGFAALLGGHVANDGYITARLGHVALGSGELMTLDLSGDGFLSVGIPTKDLSKLKGADGKPLVSNTGHIVADGGVVELKAATAAGILSDAVNVPGSIEANSVGMRDGKIVLGGGAGGQVRVAGNLTARGSKTSDGGRITITGNDVALNGTASVDVSGANGGTFLIGGDVHGGADPSADFSITPVENASITTVEVGAELKADGINGNGGNIVVWSNDQTTYAGHLSVASTNGAGGFAEVSGHKLLNFTGSVDLAGTSGTGTLLLDPQDVTIGTSGTWIVTPTALESALAGGNVLISTDDSLSGTGDVTFVKNVTWGSSGNLFIGAYHDIVVDNGVTIKSTGSGSLYLGAGVTSPSGDPWYGNGTGTIDFNGTGKIDFSNSTGYVNFAYNPPNGYTNPESFTAHVATNSAVANQFTPYMWVNNIDDLQNVSQNLSGNYALANNIDAGATAHWNGGAGFIPIGNGSAPFTGSFVGVGGSVPFIVLGATVSNLVINSSATEVGLFGENKGTIANISLSNVNVTGSNSAGIYVGGLVGFNRYPGTIYEAKVAGLVQTIGVNNYQHIGGMAGSNDGTITLSSSSAAVKASAGGNNNAQYTFGGLVGSNSGSINKSFATGPVSADDTGGNGGGLVGFNHYLISQSFSTGSVTANAGGVGGLVGWNMGFISGGGKISQSYETGRVTVTGGGSAAGLVGIDDTGAAIIQSYATGFISTPGSAYGLVKPFGYGGGVVEYSYWNTDTTGQPTSGEGTAITTTELTSALPPGFDPSAWGRNTNIDNGYPYLLWQMASTSPTAPATVLQPVSGSQAPHSGATKSKNVTTSFFGIPITFTPAFSNLSNQSMLAGPMFAFENGIPNQGQILVMHLDAQLTLPVLAASAGGLCAACDAAEATQVASLIKVVSSLLTAEELSKLAADITAHPVKGRAELKVYLLQYIAHHAIDKALLPLLK